LLLDCSSNIAPDIEAALTIISANKMPEWLVIVIFTGTAA
jgi:hypothetical protein